MVRKIGNLFELKTENTSYIFRVTAEGILEHLYYGAAITVDEKTEEMLREKVEFPLGNAISYTQDKQSLCIDNLSQEISGRGKGDQRAVMVLLEREDGSQTTDFLYDHFEIDNKQPELKNLPASYREDAGAEKRAAVEEDAAAEKKAAVEEDAAAEKKIAAEDSDTFNHLRAVLKDGELELCVDYYTYDECDVITRTVKLFNNGKSEIKLRQLLSNQVDFDRDDFIFTTFNGSWAREMHREDTNVRKGRIINSSANGTSSNRANPFAMLAEDGANEDTGEVYGFNLIYSGNHYESVEVSPYGKTRFMQGINPEGFCFVIAEGEDFETPEAVMTYSLGGYNGMSHNMHRFVREHIVRGKWKKKVRPVLLNSWEAAYFDINEDKLCKLAKKGAEAGIELFVMDDGWFGHRDNDTSSLGDWGCNTKKLPGGLSGLAKKINSYGLDFGIWVEPEMVNVDSNLYKAHPDWAVDIPGRAHSEGRNQRILDLANPEVCDYIITSMSEVFASANIAYVKWDMNRNFSDYYSKYLPAKKQGEFAHRYVQGLYRCMRELTEKFPDILFEGCSAGGNRFDLGILSYFPQIWASDDTDAFERTMIQQGYSYGYPMSVVSAHVSSCPNHQTLRTTPLSSRFNVAAFGICGYECNFCDLKEEEFSEIKNQIELYKNWRETLQFGEFYRYKNPNENKLNWMCVSPDKNHAVGLLFQKLVTPNSTYDCFKARGLMPDKIYEVENVKLKYNVKNFGDLVNTVAPFHIKQDSVLHNLVAKFVKMDGEYEHYEAYGDAMMKAGIRLKQAFAATGYSDQVRYFQDFSSRLYFFTCKN